MASHIASYVFLVSWTLGGGDLALVASILSSSSEDELLGVVERLLDLEAVFEGLSRRDLFLPVVILEVRV